MKKLPVLQPTTPSGRRRAEVLEQLAGELDPRFFKALSEPVRLEIFKLLIVRGTLDIDSVAAELPQDRSVISRHLAALQQAGVLSVTKDGRHVRYRVDGTGMLGKLERLLSLMREAMAVCCPPGA